VRPWEFTATSWFYILLTQLREPPQFQERAWFRCELIWRALNACLIVANNKGGLNYMLPVNMQVGLRCSASTHDP